MHVSGMDVAPTAERLMEAELAVGIHDVGVIFTAISALVTVSSPFTLPVSC
jgi:hypothetical protein